MEGSSGGKPRRPRTRGAYVSTPWGTFHHRAAGVGECGGGVGAAGRRGGPRQGPAGRRGHWQVRCRLQLPRDIHSSGSKWTFLKHLAGQARAGRGSAGGKAGGGRVHRVIPPDLCTVTREAQGRGPVGSTLLLPFLLFPSLKLAGPRCRPGPHRVALPADARTTNAQCRPVPLRHVCHALRVHAQPSPAPGMHTVIMLLPENTIRVLRASGTRLAA